MDPESLSNLSSQLNTLPDDVFQRLVTGAFEAILSELRSPTSSNWPSLSPDSLQKLTSLLPSKISSSASLLVESLHRLLVHVSRTVVKPKQFQRALAEAGLEAARTELLVTAWKANAADIVERLKEASFSNSNSDHLLADVTWKVQLLTESSYEADRRLPLGQLDFVFQKSSADDGNKNEVPSSHLSVNFSHAELATFYSSLEAVQAKIDQLNQQGQQQQQQH